MQWPDAASALLSGGPVELAVPNAALGGGVQVVNQDPKSTLNMFAQRHCKKTISKEDIVYNVVRHGYDHQATVTMACLDGVQFAGDICKNAKDAEKSAATMALQHFADEVAVALAQPKSKGSNNKRKASTAGIGGGAFAGEDLSALGGLPAGGTAGGANGVTGDGHDNSRSLLNRMLMRVLKRSLQKEDIVYTSSQTTAGYQCTIALPCLSGEWAGLQWAGDVSTKKKQAEENAAHQAVLTLGSDPVVQAAMAAPAASKQPRTNFKGGGKGKGKGKGGGGGGFQQPGFGWASTDMGLAMAMNGMGGLSW